MNDAVEIEIEVVELDIVWVGGGDVDGDCDAVNFLGGVFDDAGDDFWVLFTEPAECRWNTNPINYNSTTLLCDTP